VSKFDTGSLAANEKSQEGERRGEFSRKWRIQDWFDNFDVEKEKKLRAYFIELIHFNGRINLISTRSEENGDLIHITDCIIAGSIILGSTKQREIYDIGSGNGLPGIVMAILDPDRQFVLIDRDAKKIEFIKHICSRVGIKNVSAQQARVEDLKSGTVHCAVSRGFASLSKSVITLRKASPVGGEYFHMKSDSWVREVAQIPTQLCAFWEPSLVSEYQLPTVESKFSVVLTKKIRE